MAVAPADTDNKSASEAVRNRLAWKPAVTGRGPGRKRIRVAHPLERGYTAIFRGSHAKCFLQGELGNGMRFHLVDRVLEAGPSQLRAVKNLTLGEEYLADHFPTFPVMPGVLMLEAVVEAAAWLLRYRDEYAHSVIVLREAKNVKYGTFMEPGRSLMLTVELTGEEGNRATFKGKGEVDGNQAVGAVFTLTRYNLREQNPAWEARDRQIVAHLREMGELLRGKPAAV